jgi:hypothetical protein
MQGNADVRNPHPAERRKEAAGPGPTPVQRKACNLSALMIAETRCCRGVRYKNSVARHQLLSASKNLELCGKLFSGTYQTGIGDTFPVYEPKYRIVTSTLFGDRIPQASFVKNFIYPELVPTLIKENYACIKGRGVDAAREHMKEMLETADPENDVVVKADIANYFGSIEHDILISEVMLGVSDTWAMEYFAQVINCNKRPVGIGLGSEINQLSAVLFLNEMDHLLKSISKSYARYMDDIVLVINKNDALYALSVIEEEMERLHLQLSPKKTFIQPASRPVSFLGFTFKRHADGRVTLKRIRAKVKNEKQKLRRMKEAGAPFENIQEHYTSVRATMKKGSRSDMMKLDRYFNNLFKEELMKIKKNDIEQEKNEKNVAVIAALVKESSEEDQKINTYIREQYSMSQELALHRKRLMGTLSAEEWQTYTDYVEECIAKAREEHSGDETE